MLEVDLKQSLNHLTRYLQLGYLEETMDYPLEEHAHTTILISEKLCLALLQQSPSVSGHAML